MILFIFIFLLGFFVAYFSNFFSFHEEYDKIIYKKNKFFLTKYYLIGNFILASFFAINYINDVLFINNKLFLVINFVILIIFYIIAVIDIKTYIVPDLFQFFVFILLFLYSFLFKDNFLLQCKISIIGFVVLNIIYYTLDFFSEKLFIGYADIKLFGSILLILDSELISLYIAMIGFLGLIFKIFWKEKYIPFAPSILIIAAFFIIFPNFFNSISIDFFIYNKFAL